MTIIQLKISHEYFRLYLKNILNDYIETYTKRYNKIQIAEHLLIDCLNYKEKIDEMRKKLSLTNIIVFFNTAKEINLLIKYLKSTKTNTKK